MKKRLLLYIVLILCFNLTANAQRILRFAPRTDKFIFELGQFFDDLDAREDRRKGQEIVVRFEEFYNSDFLSEEHKMLIIKTCNQMLAQRMRPLPHFETYLKANIAFSYSELDVNSFTSWHNSFEKLLGGRSAANRFMNYLEDCISLFTHSLIFSSTSVEWAASSNQYRFHYDDQPYISFDKLDLICRSKNDSTIIFNTKGVYYPIDKKWVGQGGRLDWRRTGLDTNEVYAILKNYELRVRFPNLLADSVNFYNKNYFDYPLLGRLDEKVHTFVSAERANYPQFDSYEKRIQIKNIYDNVDFEGGFTQRGIRILGTGSDDVDAQLLFKLNNKTFITCGAKAYVFLPKRVSSQQSSVNINWEGDSIYHPSLQIDYDVVNKKLTIFRDMEGLSRSPFYSSFHELDIYVESIEWTTDLPKLDLRSVQAVSSASEAYFVSSNYFRRQNFDRLRGIDRENPLMPIKRYADAYHTREIYLDEYARFLKVNIANVKAQLLRIANLGFIMYDLENEKFYVKDRLINNINCYYGRSDYDVIDFLSVTNRVNNATISLLNFDLRIEGVNQIILSDSQNVIIYPFQNQITVKKNRDFTFDGKIIAGLFTLHGKECYFDYERFKLELPIIDSLSFKVRSFSDDDKYDGQRYLVDIKSVLEDLAGNILLNHPNNKSGIKPFHEYPILNSVKHSYVYYDRRDIHNGVYKRDRFYYRINPFTIDSLDNFTTEGLSFNGYLSSSGIFPDIEEDLRVMRDYSLGFTNSAPASGYPVYGGKGQFFNEVNVSNKGLRGDGSLDYLTSTTHSHDFLFFPDSMSTIAHRYLLREQIADVEYPGVIAEDVAVRWHPYKDVMQVSKIKSPLIMYNNQSLLNGSIKLTPGSLVGNGMMQIGDAEMDSEHFRFKNKVYDADTSNFRLKMTFDEFNIGATATATQYAYETQNFKGHVDFERRLGEFEAISGDSMVSFPANLYICYMDKFVWHMDKDETEFSSSKGMEYSELSKLGARELADLEIEGSKFVSIHPEQDSLQFIAQTAIYKRAANTIIAKDVARLFVADAMIIPDRGDVTVLRKAEMKPFTDSRIVANVAMQYHNIHSASINVYGRKRYDARGVYNYMDENGTIQNIYFSNIGVDTTFQTIASGEIHPSAAFTLSPMFAFRGDVELYASEQYLTFDGATRINHRCDTVGREWMSFRTAINPIEIAIPVASDLRNLDGFDIYASMMISDDTIGVYPSFLARAERRTDTPVITADGVLVYDKISDQYRIADAEKHRQLSRPGNLLSLDRRNCVVYAEGALMLGRDFGRSELNFFGELRHFIHIDSTEINAMAVLNFHFSDDALKMLNDNLSRYHDFEGLDLNSPAFQKGMGEILGDEQAQDVIAELTMNYTIRRLPQELRNTFTLADVTLRWNPKTKAFVSEGKIGIAFIDRNQVYKYVDGILEVSRNRNGDEYTLYIELDEDDWYYFEYQRVGRMLVFSSNDEFNQTIRDTKQDARRIRAESGQRGFEYRLGSQVNRRRFLQKYRPD